MKVPFPTAIVGTVALSGVVQTVAQIIRATVVAEAVTPIATGANGEVTFSVEEVAYYVSAKKLSGESTIGTNAAGFTVVQPAEYEDVSIPYSTYYGKLVVFYTCRLYEY
ncbi:hypothetical protein H0H92_007396 [Tricholoma furcatifolium]|nr:hypothetical protein H0H92_007396 [Tricholoma furcatifolium]